MTSGTGSEGDASARAVGDGKGRLLLLGAGLLAAAAIGEGGLRLLARTSDRIAAPLRTWDPFAVQVEPLGERSYAQRPGAVFRYPNGSTAIANRMGFRGPEVAVPKPPGTFRIVLLGGSTTHGWGVDDASTIDAHLRRALAARFPGRRFDVVNLGFDGFDSEDDAERLRVQGLPLEPDAVVFHTGINDVPAAAVEPPHARPARWQDPVLSRVREERRRGGPLPWSLVKHHLYLARLPGLLLRGSEGPVDPAPGPPVPPPRGPDRFEATLLAAALLPPPETILVFSTPPSGLELPSPPPSSSRGHWVVDGPTTVRYRDALAARMRRVAEGLAAGGRRTAFVAHRLRREDFLDDCHVTSEGNRIVAENFLEALARWLGVP